MYKVCDYKNICSGNICRKSIFTTNILMPQDREEFFIEDPQKKYRIKLTGDEIVDRSNLCRSNHYECMWQALFQIRVIFLEITFEDFAEKLQVMIEPPDMNPETYFYHIINYCS